MAQLSPAASNTQRLSDVRVRDLLNLVIEFLTHLQYSDTVDRLLRERTEKRNALNNSVVQARAQTREARDRLRAEMLRKFDEGKRDDFLTLWHQYVPAQQQAGDYETQKLEFSLQVYFAIYPVLPSSSVLVVTPGSAPGASLGAGPGNSNRLSAQRGSARHELGQRMKVFKGYLEGRGASLAHTPEFLPFYALPYVSQPEHHPSYEPMFQPEWAGGQRQQLKGFLEGVAERSSAGPPLLYVMYEEHLKATDGAARLSPRSKAMRDSTRAPSFLREGGPRSSASATSQAGQRGLGRSASLTARGGTLPGGRGLSPEKLLPPTGSGGSNVGLSYTASPMRSRAGLPPRTSQSPFRGASGPSDGGGGPVAAAAAFVAARNSHKAAAGSKRAGKGKQAEAGDSDDDFIRDLGDEDTSDDGSQHGAQQHDSSAGQGKADTALAGPSGALQQGGGAHQKGGGRGGYEDSFDEAEMAEALRSPAGADLAGRSRAATRAAGLSLEELGMGEGGVLRDSVQLLQGSTDDFAALGGLASLHGEGGSGSGACGLAPLDYRRVKEDLTGADPFLVARLLQALRWRLTRSRPGPDRWHLLASWVEADLLDCHGPAEDEEAGGKQRQRQQQRVHSSLLQVLSAHPDPRVTDQLARLCNAIASDRLGRNYLMQPCGSAVQSLMAVLHAAAAGGGGGVAVGGGGGGGGVQDGPSVLQVLVVLQKLSLRRVAQSQMIAAGAVQWLLDFLQDPAALSPHSLEYGSALLMNLCLRSEGRHTAAAPERINQLLRVCENALQAGPNDQVRTYVHGTLYSVLRLMAAREAALSRGTAELLEASAQTAPPVFESQVHHILALLRGPPDDAAEEAEASDDGCAPDGDVDLDGELEAEGSDPFADVDVNPDALETVPGVPTGEELLCGCGYLASSEAAKAHMAAVRSSMAAAAVAAAAAGVGQHTLRGSRMLAESLRQSALFGATLGGPERSQQQRTRLLSAVQDEGEEELVEDAAGAPPTRGSAAAPAPARGARVSTGAGPSGAGEAGGGGGGGGGVDGAADGGVQCPPAGPTGRPLSRPVTPAALRESQVWDAAAAPPAGGGGGGSGRVVDVTLSPSAALDGASQPAAAAAAAAPQAGAPTPPPRPLHRIPSASGLVPRPPSAAAGPARPGGRVSDTGDRAAERLGTPGSRSASPAPGPRARGIPDRDGSTTASPSRPSSAAGSALGTPTGAGGAGDGGTAAGEGTVTSLLPASRFRTSTNGGSSSPHLDGSLTSLARAAAAVGGAASGAGSPLVRSPSRSLLPVSAGVPTAAEAGRGASASPPPSRPQTGGPGAGGEPSEALQEPAAGAAAAAAAPPKPRARMGPPRPQEMHGPKDELVAFATKREIPRTPAGHTG